MGDRLRECFLFSTVSVRFQYGAGAAYWVVINEYRSFEAGAPFY